MASPAAALPLQVALREEVKRILQLPREAPWCAVLGQVATTPADQLTRSLRKLQLLLHPVPLLKKR